MVDDIFSKKIYSNINVRPFYIIKNNTSQMQIIDTQYDLLCVNKDIDTNIKYGYWKCATRK